MCFTSPPPVPAFFCVSAERHPQGVIKHPYLYNRPLNILSHYFQYFVIYANLFSKIAENNTNDLDLVT